jgi:hypothetical protein
MGTGRFDCKRVVEGRAAKPLAWNDLFILAANRGRSCAVCGCFTDWRSTGGSYGKVGINARLLDGYSERDGRSLFEGREIEVRPMDNAGS